MKTDKMKTEHLENFRAVNKRLGLHEDTVTPHHNNDKGMLKSKSTNGIVYSSDPEKSTYPPLIITINSVAEYNKMLGKFDDNDDKHIEYPSLTDSLRMKLKSTSGTNEKGGNSMAHEDLEVIRKAKEAFIMGDSKKVKDFEPLINEVHFPMKVAYFADTDDKEISTPEVVDGSDPVVWNYNSIIIDDQGSLTAYTELHISANTLKSINDPSEGAREATGDDKIITAIGGAPTNPTATNGGPGQKGGTGNQGSSAVCGSDSSIKGTPPTCKTPPGDGTQGTQGTNGGAGSPGNQGNPQLPLNITINDTITGNLIIQGGGGIGQNGGNGGNGGDGGDGGAAGVNCDPCTAAAPGAQGLGGNGGNGGNAGNGGNGAAINVSYNTLVGNLTTNYIGGQPGQPGQGGQAGAGGGGTTGTNGQGGAQGSKSTITVTQL